MDKLQELEALEEITQLAEPVETITLQAPKKKRTPTPKQLEVLKKARETMLMKAKESQAKKKLEEDAIELEVKRRVDEYRKGLEERIIKKAVSIKKKQIKKQAVLEEISDDDTPMEKIKELANKKQIQRLPATEAVNTKPKYVFV